MKIIKSPFGYLGGKSRIAKFIANQIPNNIEIMIEPFCGSAVVSLTAMQLNPNLKELYCWDIHNPLISMYQGIQSDNNFIEHFKDIPRTKESWELIKYIDIETWTPPQYLFMLMSCFNNDVLQPYYSIHKVRELEHKDIAHYVELLKNKKLVFESKDYFTNKKFINNKNVFWYYDPPYINVKRALYKNHKEFNHTLLCEMIKKTKGKWILSYDDNPLVREMYKDYYIYEKEFLYSMNRNKRQRKIELIISNFELKGIERCY